MDKKYYLQLLKDSLNYVYKHNSFDNIDKAVAAITIKEFKDQDWDYPEMTKDYINTHYKYVESLEYIFSLDKFFSEQLDLLYDTVHNIVLDIDTDIECAFEDTFFDKENFVFNLRDSITNSIQSNI